MKRLILLHIVCCCFLVGKADYEMNTDSLIQVFQNLPHDSTRLVALNNIIRIEQNNPKCILFSDTLMKEALFQKDDKYAGLAACAAANYRCFSTSSIILYNYLLAAFFY